MASSLIEAKRKEFLNALVAVRPPNRFKIVVVDKRSLRVLNDVLKLSEVLEHDVLRIESIENGRKEDSSTEALYFLTPSKQSVERLKADFATAPAPSMSSSRGFSSSVVTKRAPTYRAGHVYFTSELPDSLFAMLRSPEVAQHLRALKELCIEYDVYDMRVFLTKLADRPLYRLYSPIVSNNCNEELDLISKKLVNVCGALKEDPVVRFFSPDHEIYGNTMSRKLAFLFHTEMERVRQSLNSGDSADRSTGGQTELIIVDRSADPFTPVLHEFTYEAMVYDLLDIEDGNKFKYVVQLANGTEEEKSVTLDDSDPIWQEYRFQHISEAQEHIMKKFQGLLGSNRAILDMQAGEKLNLSKMRDVVSNMPNFKDQLSLMSAHITMMQQCMDQFNERCLNDLGMLEQNLAMGMDPEGEKYQTGDIDVAQILNNPAINAEDKLRLLVVFYISNPSLTETERMKLARLANLDRNARATVQNMGFIVRWAHALNLVRELSKKRPQQPKSAGGAGASKWSLASIRTAGSSGSSLGDEPKPFDLSRYVPVAKHILEQCIEGWLSEDVFPYVVPPERPTAQAAMGSPRSGSLRGSAGSRVASGQPDRSGSPASGMWSSLVSSVVSNNSTEPPLPSGPPRQVRSLRSTKPTWQKRDSTPGSSANVSSMASGSPRTPQLDAPSPGAGYGNQGQRNSQHARPRVVLFVIGGVTYSEVRAADEIARKYGREVIIGSTHMLTPHAYLQDTSTLNFELVDERGRVLDIKPSFYTLGYGGPAEIDPLNSYVPPAKGGGEAKKQPPKTARSTSAGPPESYPRQQSRQQQQPPPSMSQHRSAGRVSSHQSSSSGGGSGGGYDRATSEPRASMRSTSTSRVATVSSEYPSHEYSPRTGNSESFSAAGYHEYKQHKAATRTGASSTTNRQDQRYGHSTQMPASAPPYQTSNNTPPPRQYQQQQQQQQQQYQQPQQQQQAPPMTPEEVFRAKLERSQRDWQTTVANSANVNPAMVSDMHRVSIGRGNQHSSSEKKHHGFLKRIL